AGAGDAVDDAGVGVHHAGGDVHRAREVELAAAQRDRAGRGEALEDGGRRLEGGAAVAGVAALAGPGDGADHARPAFVDGVETPRALVEQVALIAFVHRDAARLVDGRHVGRAAVTAEAVHVAGDDLDDLGIRIHHADLVVV